MKTTQHHQLCALLAASLVLIIATGHLHGAVNIFTNANAWERAAADAGTTTTTSFGFNFFPPNPRPAAISNQYYGFEFLPQDGRYPITIDYVTNGVLSTPLFPNTG